MDGGKGYGLKTHWVCTYQKKKKFVTIRYCWIWSSKCHCRCQIVIQQNIRCLHPAYNARKTALKISFIVFYFNFRKITFIWYWLCTVLQSWSLYHISKSFTIAASKLEKIGYGNCLLHTLLLFIMFPASKMDISPCLFLPKLFSIIKSLSKFWILATPWFQKIKKVVYIGYQRRTLL